MNTPPSTPTPTPMPMPMSMRVGRSDLPWIAVSPRIPHRSLLLFLLCLGCIWRSPTSGAASVDSNGHLWLNYVGDHPVGDGPWGIHLEGQFRRSELGGDWQQILIRPGINYQLSERVALSGGYGFVEGFPYGDFPVAHRFPEHRLWEQVSVKTPWLGRDWTHRVRLEQRWLGSMQRDADGWFVDRYRYSNRLRYMLRTTIPLTADKRWYIPVWDEVFVNFGGDFRRNDFDQNRFFAGLGRQFAPHWRWEVGFMEQTVQQRGGKVWEANHTIMITLFSSAAFDAR